MVHRNDIKRIITMDLVSMSQAIHDGDSDYLKLETNWEFDQIKKLPAPRSLSCRFDDMFFVKSFWNLKLNKSPNNNFEFHLDLLMNDIRRDNAKSLFEGIHGFNGSVFQTGEWGNHIEINKTFSYVNDFLTAVSHPDFIFKEAFSEQFDRSLFNYIGSFRLSPQRSNLRQSKALDRVLKDGSGYLDQIIEWEDTNPEKFQELNDRLNELELLESVVSRKTNGGSAFDISVRTKKSSHNTNIADVGFGVSQFLPILVADLQLPAESCLAISQPEIHLHPKIQAQFGNYLSGQIRQNKKQYIIETHSEYLLNRIRLLLVQGELKPQDVNVYYFENDGIRSETHHIEFCTDGQIKGAPDGFFDTYGIDVLDIAMSSMEA